MKNPLRFLSIAKKISWILTQLVGSLLSLGALTLFFLLAFLSLRPLPLDFLLPHLTPHLSTFSPQLACENLSLVWKKWSNPFELQVDGLVVHLSSQKIHIPRAAFHLSLLKALQGKIVISKATLFKICVGVGGEKKDSTWAESFFPLESVFQTLGSSFGSSLSTSLSSSLDPSFSVSLDPSLDSFLSSSFLGGLNDLTLKEVSFRVPFCTKSLTWPFLTLHFRRKKDMLLVEAFSQNKCFFKGKIHLNIPEGLLTLSFSLKEFKFPSDFFTSPSFQQGVLAQKDASVLEALPPLSGSLEGVYDLAQKKWKAGRAALLQEGEKEHIFPGSVRPLSMKDFKATLALENPKIILENLSFKLEGLPFKIRGNFNENSHAFFCEAWGPNPLPLDLLLVLWPRELAQNPRKWIVKNLANGHIKNVFALGTGRWDLKSPPLITQFSGDMLLEGFTVTYLRGMPVVKGACGKAIFDKNRFLITFTKGVLEKQLLQKGTLLIDGLDSNREKLETDLDFQGPLPNILEIIDHPPLEYAKKLGLVACSFKGNAKTNLKLDFPLKKDLLLKEINVKVASQLKDVSFSHRIEKTSPAFFLSKGDLKLNLTSKGLNVEGFGEVNKQPAQIFWTEKWGPKAQSRYGLKAQVTAAQLLLWGVNLTPWVSGLFDISLVYNASLVKKDSFLDVNVDFLKSVLNIPFLSWKKPAGEAALLTTQVKFDPSGKTYLQNLHVRGENLKGVGSMVLSQEREVKSFELSYLEAPETNASLSLTHDLHKGYVLNVKGKSFNFSSFLDEQEGSTPFAFFKPGAPFTLSLSLEKVVTGKRKSLRCLSGELKGKQKAEEVDWEAVQLSGISGTRMPQKEEHSLSRPGEFLIYFKEGTFLVRANDAGAFLKNLGVHRDIKGGSLALEAKQKGLLRPYEGWLKIKDFEAMDVPILTHILSLVSPTGLIDFFSSGGLYFDRFDTRFSALNSSITLHQAKGVSTGLGIIFKGKIDLKNKTLFLTGNIIPAYMINSILSAIPFFGSLLLGSVENGFLATHFTLRGPLNAPQIYINPLSSFAPGFFKKLFEDGEEGFEE